MINHKKAQIAINLFVIGTFVVCLLALLSFSTNSNKAKFNFYGVSALQEENTKIEQARYNEYFQLITTNKEFQCSSQDICNCPRINSIYNDLIIKDKNINDLILNNPSCLDKSSFKLSLSKFMKTLSDTNSIYVNSKCNCKDNCQQYADVLVETGCDYNIDPYLLLSIIMQESQCISSAENKNPDSSDCGLMQVNTKSFEECNKLKSEIDYSINQAVNLLEDKSDKECTFTGGKYSESTVLCDASNLMLNSGCTRSIVYSGWAAKIRGYNGWGSGGESYYPELVLERYLELKGLKEKLSVQEIKSSANNIQVNYNSETNVLLNNIQ